MAAISLVAICSAVGGCIAAEGSEEDAVLSVWAASSTALVLERVAADPAFLARMESSAPQRLPAARIVPDATSRIAAQLQSGAPADIFVSADRAWMEWAVDRGLVRGETVEVVARNALVLAVQTASRLRAADFQEALASGGLERLGVAGEEVPAGRYARQAIEAIAPNPRLRIVTGGSVRSVTEWAAAGEVDGAIVYGTELHGDSRVRMIAPVPAELHGPVEVLAGVVSASPRQPQAEAWIEALLEPAAQLLLVGAGFGPADSPAPEPSPASTARPAESLATPALSAPGASAGALAVSSSVSTGSAIRLSVQVALLATLLALVPAVLLGWLLARRDFVGKSLVSAVILAPMVVPPVVTGFLLLRLLGTGGPVGTFLSSLGISLPFTYAAAVIAAAVVGFPLFVITVRNAFETVDPGLEEMSRTLGATPWRTFRRISLPLARSGIVAGMILAFARALGEFGATVVLAGNLEGETRTIALAVYTLLEAPAGQRQVWVLVGASMAISFLALAGFETLSRRQRALVRRDGHG